MMISGFAAANTDVRVSTHVGYPILSLYEDGKYKGHYLDIHFRTGAASNDALIDGLRQVLGLLEDERDREAAEKVETLDTKRNAYLVTAEAGGVAGVTQEVTARDAFEAEALAVEAWYEDGYPTVRVTDVAELTEEGSFATA